MRDAAERLRALAGRERLPPRLCAARARVHCGVGVSTFVRGFGGEGGRTGGPVHHVGGALVRPEEEQLGLAVQVDEALFDPGALAGNEQVDDRIDVLLKAQPRFRVEPITVVSPPLTSSKAGGTHAGRIVPLAPPSGISLFFKLCVDASP